LRASPNGVAPTKELIRNDGIGIACRAPAPGWRMSATGASVGSHFGNHYYQDRISLHRVASFVALILGLFPVIAASQALPQGWTAADVGAPAIAGDATFNSGTYSVSGAGAGVWGTSDQFHFAYVPASGDIDIIARVRVIGDTDPWSKAGVMIRASLAPTAAHASMFVSSSQGVVFQRRPTPAGATVSLGGTRNRAPHWIKLSVRGGVVTASKSLDGTMWVSAGTQTLTLPSQFYVGLAVTSHDETMPVAATIDAVSIVGLSQNQPPTVSLTEPVDGAAYGAPAAIALRASASDSDGSVARVEFYQGSTLIGSDAIAPYDITWSGVPAGTYSLTAVAVDDDGATAASPARTVIVTAANQPPGVTLTAPPNDATFTAPASITVSADASDSDGTITRVDFYQGTTLIGFDTTSPYTVPWNNVPAGTYTLTAAARDDDGAVTTSVARTVTVHPPANQSPSVSMTAPSHGASFTAPATMTVSADASDPDGSIVRVDFYQGSTQIGTDASTPYSVTWSDVPPGSYALTAVAIDNAGATTTSAASVVTVTVSSSLPPGWTATDIGSPAHAGTTSYSGGTFTIDAGGLDIFGGSDQFHFAYYRFSGDVDVVAHVTSMGQTHPWSKGGLMIRASLAPDSRHASMLATGNAGMAFIYRPSDGALSTRVSGTASPAPMWVKLTVRGSTVTAFESTNGIAWTQVGSQALAIPASFYVGLAVSSHEEAVTVRARFDQVSIAAPPANQPPNVSLTAPANGATFTAPATVTLSADASDADGSVTRVDFYHESTLIGSDTTSPYTVTWGNAPQGTYSLTAIATDSGGATATSPARTITVDPGAARLGVVFTASADHAALVNSYVLEVFAEGADPATATPVASQNLGKPEVINGECTAEVTATINGLSPGNYQMTIAAVGVGGWTRSAPAAFTR
jgi:hypothetical protein